MWNQQKIDAGAPVHPPLLLSATAKVDAPALTAFDELTDSDGKSPIEHSALKSCALDPMPSRLVSRRSLSRGLERGVSESFA